MLFLPFCGPRAPAWVVKVTGLVPFSHPPVILFQCFQYLALECPRPLHISGGLMPGRVGREVDRGAVKQGTEGAQVPPEKTARFMLKGITLCAGHRAFMVKIPERFFE